MEFTKRLIDYELADGSSSLRQDQKVDEIGNSMKKEKPATGGECIRQRRRRQSISPPGEAALEEEYEAAAAILRGFSGGRVAPVLNPINGAALSNFVPFSKFVTVL